MGNWALSLLLMGAFFGFLLIMSHLAIRQLLKGYKLNKQGKQYDGINGSGHKSKPIYFQRGKNDSIYDPITVEKWQDMGIISPDQRRAYFKKFEANSKTHT